MCIKIFKNFLFHARNDFSQNELLLENAQLGLSEGKNLKLDICEWVTRVIVIFYKRRQGVISLWKMWLLVLLVLKLKYFLPEAAILHGCMLVTRWLLVCYSLMEIFTRYPIKEEINLDKYAPILLERWYLWLHLWGIWQMIIGLLFNTEPCFGNVNTY